MRTYKRKTKRASATQEQIRTAANAVLKNGQSVRSAAFDFGISRMTLTRFVNKLKTQEQCPKMGYAAPRQVFTTEQEEKLKNYLLKISDIYFGLTPKDVRCLAYDCAVKYRICYPDSWKINKMTGADWLSAFLKRNTGLSIRRSEATSTMSFTKTNVNDFFDKLGLILDKYKFTASKIWNVDETGISTVLKPNKTVAAKGKRNVGSIISAARNTNVTLIAAVSASGNTVPSMFIFPRKKYYFLSNGPSDIIEMENASGWATNDEFYIFMKHFIKYVKPSVEDPILLLLDNHSSHLTIEIIDLAEDSGVVMLSFPPYCSHRLQPLDVSVFRLFKKYLATAQDEWLRSNVGKTMTIYDLPKIVSETLPLAITTLNIIDGFKKTGIFPYNRQIFTDSDFAPSCVTDHPEDQTALQPNTQAIEEDNISTSSASNNYSSTFKDDSVSSDSKENIEFSPEIIKPFPKTGPRKTQVERKKRESIILTSTPEKTALAENQNQRKKRKIEKDKKEVERELLYLSNCEDKEDYCLECGEAYSESLPGEEWIQCHGCQGWAHSKCTSAIIFLCINCNNDND